MTKKELVSAVCRETGAKRWGVELVLDSIIKTIMMEAGKGNTVKITNFGKFERKLYKGRTITSPLTSDQTYIPDRYVVKFTPGTMFTRISNIIK